MTPRFQGNFTQQLPIPEEGIERAVAFMRSGRLHRYNVIDDEVPETVQLENELAAYMGARDDALRLLHAVRQACRGSGRRRVRPGSPRHAELLGAHGQSESGDAELGLSTTDRPGERPESAAVSRRPSALLDRSVLEQLSRRTNLHGLAYFLGHHRFTQVPGKDPSLVLVLPTPATFGQYLWYCAGLWFWWRNTTCFRTCRFTRCPPRTIWSATG